MIVHEVTTEYKYGDAFRLKVCADWHLGHRYSDKKAIKEYLSDGVNDPACYLVTNGDLIDGIIITDKRYRKSVDEAPGEAIIDYQIDQIKELLEPYRGRILGFGFGNHEDTLLAKAGTHISRRLAEYFQTVSLGLQWYLIWTFSENGARRRTLTIFAHHGYGAGARTEGAAITKYSQHAAGYDGDIFLYGHDHKRTKHDLERMALYGHKIISNPKRIYLCGTFLKTFSSSDEPTWAEKKGFKPVRIGGINLSIKPHWQWFKIDSDI